MESVVLQSLRGAVWREVQKRSGRDSHDTRSDRSRSTSCQLVVKLSFCSWRSQRASRVSRAVWLGERTQVAAVESAPHAAAVPYEGGAAVVEEPE